jgi:hypothetical protein
LYSLSEVRPIFSATSDTFIELPFCLSSGFRGVILSAPAPDVRA